MSQTYMECEEDCSGDGAIGEALENMGVENPTAGKTLNWK